MRKFTTETRYPIDSAFGAMLNNHYTNREEQS
jgi:hypothetical protein